MFHKVTVLLVCFLTAPLWGQITKDQIYAMTEKKMDESVIISMVKGNCVDFDINGQIVVELAARVSPEVLRTIVDCILERRDRERSAAEEIGQDLSKVEEAAREAAQEVAEEAATAVKEIAADVTEDSRGQGFAVPQYISVNLMSNKSSYTVGEMEFRVVSLKSKDSGKDVRFRFTGEGNTEEEIRCYKRSGPETLQPGEYIGYLHVVSTRKKGIMGKKMHRTDLHKFFIEYKGTGPIFLDYQSKEDGAFTSKKAINLEVKGPLTFHGEEHISVEGQKTIDDLLALIQS